MLREHLATGMAPFAALMGETIADRLGAPLTVAVAGVGCIVGAVIFGVKLPNE
jgi:hypothetical protein